MDESEWQSIIDAERCGDRHVSLSGGILEPLSVGIIPDLHAPFHDKERLHACLSDLKGSDHLILLGDCIDAYSVSDFNKDPARRETLQDELDVLRRILERIRRENPNARIDYIMGNHEERIKRYTWSKAPALATLRDLSLDKLLKLEKFRVTLHPRSGFKAYGVRWKHGDLVRKKSGHTAAAEMEEHRCSGGSGHTHRMGKAKRVDREGVETTWWEWGHLCDTDQAEYVKNPDWNPGYGKCVVYPDSEIEWTPVEL